jgi:hypothetical protein
VGVGLVLLLLERSEVLKEITAGMHVIEENEENEESSENSPDQCPD